MITQTQNSTTPKWLTKSPADIQRDKKLTATQEKWSCSGNRAWSVGPEFNGLDRATIGYRPVGDGVYDAYIMFKGGRVATSAFVEKQPTCADARDVYRSYIQLVDEVVVEKGDRFETWVRDERGVFDRIQTKAKRAI